MLSNYLNNNTKAALSALAAGNRFYKNGDYQRAIESYDKAISLKLGDTKFCAKNYFNKGLAQKKLYRYIDSIESYNKAIMLDDKHILAYLAKAEVLQNMQEEHNEASEIEILDCLNTAYEISRDKSLLDSMKLSKVNLDYIQRMFGEREKLLEKFKVASEESNIPAEALAKAQDENSLANDASKDGASMQNPQELLDIGDELFLYLDKIEEAIELYDQAILLDNNLARAYSKKANLLRFQGMITEAIEVINKAINLDPNDPAGYYVKVRILAAQGNTEEATSIYNKALSLDHNDDAYTYFSKGVALTVLSIHEESIEAYDEVIRLKSGNNIFCAAAWNNKGYALNELSRHEEAIVSCNESIRIKPDFTIAYNNKGAALNYLGRYTETIEVLDESIKLKPDDAFA
ncbi:MAG: tetratricopeptide repeat protein, partial [Rickettsiaceae bacterium]|nr:tetratricopeptide repeat protein [Rickettsiaceae bacterium]